MPENQTGLSESKSERYRSDAVGLSCNNRLKQGIVGAKAKANSTDLWQGWHSVPLHRTRHPDHLGVSTVTDTVGESALITPLPLILVATPRNGISVFSHVDGPSWRGRINLGKVEG